MEVDSGSDNEYTNGDNNGKQQLTSKLIEKWSKNLEKDKPFDAIRETVSALKAVLKNVVSAKKDDTSLNETNYYAEGSDLFNSVIRLCMKDLIPCIYRILDLTVNDADQVKKKIRLPSEGNYWKTVKAPIKAYLGDILNLTSNINEPDVLNALLRHIRVLVIFYLCFPKLLKSLTKLLITIWSQSDEKSRVIAFICLHKIVTNTHEKNVDTLLKTLYLSMVRNSKFTSINTLPLINFMQRSFIEILQQNVDLTYNHAFVYIRQLGINLRNAMQMKKKESYQAVYNWQFIHCLNFWSKLLAGTANSHESLNSLVYPLTQIIIGTLKLIPTPRYYPLRFHCINALVTLANATNTFIPILPFIIEIFDLTDFNKKHATMVGSNKVNYALQLKLNKQQIQDKSYKDTLIDSIYDYLILYLQHQSSDIAFPELCLPLVIRLKDFLKKCKSANYCKVIKGLLDKIQENCNFIEERRKTIQFSLKDKKSVEAWTDKNKQQGTPLTQWYARYKTLREQELLMEISNKDKISKNEVPVMDKQKSTVEREDDRREFDKLFGDLSDDNDSELDFTPKKKMKLAKNGENGDDSEDDDGDDSDHESFEMDSSGGEEGDSDEIDEEEQDDDNENGDDEEMASEDD